MSAADTAEEKLLVSLIAKLEAVSERRVLLESIELMMRLLARRPPNPNSPSVISGLMDVMTQLASAASADDVRNCGDKSAQLLRKALGVPDAGPVTQAEDAVVKTASSQASDDDIAYEVPEHLAHLLKRIRYEAPEPPPPTGGFASFDELCEAAIFARMDRVLTFFHRRNPEVSRILPPTFMLSPEFAWRFRKAVSKFVMPAIKESRQIRMLASSFKWEEANTETFWDNTNRQFKDKLLQVWVSAWNELKLVETRKPDGTKVMQVKAETKLLREMLAPANPDEYDIPKIGNREIDVFCSLLDPNNDWWDRLSTTWQTCHDLYEQEKDPRVFQDRAREGALRDNLLYAFQSFPDQWADFLVLSCHRVFPRVNCSFIEKFTKNVGSTDAERERHLPFVMRYLYQVKDNPEVSVYESKEEKEWEAQTQELRRWMKGEDDDGGNAPKSAAWKKAEAEAPKNKMADSWLGADGQAVGLKGHVEKRDPDATQVRTKVRAGDGWIQKDPNPVAAPPAPPKPK